MIKGNQNRVNNFVILKINGYYRCVNHSRKILTVGFKTKQVLVEYIKILKSKNNINKMMRERYLNHYKNKFI